MRQLDAPDVLRNRRLSALGENDLAAIVARAATLHERVSGRDFVPVDEDAREAALRDERLAAWRDALVKGDHTSFRRRLAWDGLDEPRVRALLGTVRLAEAAGLPSWARLLEEAVRASPQAEWRGDPASPLPFEDVLAGFVVAARGRLEDRTTAAARARLTADASAALERDLARSLSRYASPALMLELTVTRAAATSALERALVDASEEPGREVYEAFARDMKRGGLAAFFLEYAVLARQLATITELWIEATAELLSRLDADWPELVAATIPIATPVADRAPARVVAIEAGLSDPHAGRRTVAVLTFEDGAKLVYKPKPIGAERAFQDLLRWVDARAEGSPLPALGALRVIERPGYGWVEFATRAPCADAAAASRYFRRAGALLCLVYVLEGVDCHRDNVVARGENPVLVDCEGLMQPRQRLDDMADELVARFLAQEQLSHSVLRSGMLPHFQVRGSGPKRKVYDISALGGFHDEEEEATRFVWTHPNTDAMQVGLRTVTFRVAATGPSLDGRALRLADWVDDVVAGFGAAYDLLTAHRDALLREDGPIARLAREPVRFIYRNTQTYGMLTQRLVDPDFQRDGIVRGVELDLLARPHLPPPGATGDLDARPSWWPVLGAELAAMQREDIPYFGARSTENVLLVPPSLEIRGLFQAPGVEHVGERLRALGPADRARQIAYIRASLYGSRPGTTDATDARARVRGVPDADPPEPATPPPSTELTAEALRIAETIAREAVTAKEHATWIAPQFVFRSEQYMLYSLQNDLYMGVGGVALFLAEAARAAGGAPELVKLALDGVRGLRADLATRGDKVADLVGIGGANGVASMAYALTHLARTLGDEALLTDARRAADLVTPARIEADVVYDVCDGAAGAVLGLLALHEAAPDDALVDCALACGRHLERAAVRDAEGRAGWITILDKKMIGFSHGVAGIACALLRLARVADEPRLRALALDAIAYEDGLFDEASGNWPDMRRSGAEELLSASWCHGGAGISMGRLGGSLDDEVLLRDVERGVRLMMRRRISDIDYACCGNAGVVDILLSIGARLGREDVRERAVKRAWQMVTRARGAGGYALDPILPRQMLNPTYFQGVAGIGYTLLRCARPEVPSVLLWE